MSNWSASSWGIQTVTILAPLRFVTEPRFIGGVILRITEFVKIFFAIFFWKVYYKSVANQRSPGQKMIPVWMDEPLVQAIDKACSQSKPIRSRSEFIRWALVDYLREKCGLVVPEESRYAPDRTGKGGPSVRYVSSEEDVMDAQRMAADADKDHSLTAPIVVTIGRKSPPSVVSYWKTKNRKRKSKPGPTEPGK